MLSLGNVYLPTQYGWEWRRQGGLYIPIPISHRSQGILKNISLDLIPREGAQRLAKAEKVKESLSWYAER